MYLIEIIILFYVFSYRFFWKADEKKQQKGPGFELISHRGLAMDAPENTLESYFRAVDNGFSWIEMDVVSSKDGVLFCSHNMDLERETDLNGYFFDFDSDILKEAYTGIYTKHKGAYRVPDFLNVLTKLPVNVGVNVELKFKSWFDVSSARAILNYKETLNKRPYVISSFSPVILIYLKVFFRAAPTALLLESYKYFWVVNWIHPEYINPRADMLNYSLLNYCKAKKIKILTWTVNNIKTINACLGMGVHGIITDERKVL